MDKILQGCLIALEGGESVGKSTQTRLLYNRILEDYPDYAVIRSAEPSDMVRELVTQYEIHDLTRMHLITAGRAESHWTTIRPHLEKGGIVITDRYLLSTLVYQFNYSTEAQKAHDGATWEQKMHLNLVLDLPVRIAQQRVEGKSLDVLESAGLTEWANRRAHYQWYAKRRDDTVIIGANGSRGEVHEQIWGFVKPLVDLQIAKGEVVSNGCVHS